MKQKIAAIFIILFTLISCKKENAESAENDLPNYGNVELDDVFSKEDSQLMNESEIKNTLQLYYDRVWKKVN